MKTGECFFLNELGELWLATSYQDDRGLVWTEFSQVEQ